MRRRCRHQHCCCRCRRRRWFSASTLIAFSCFGKLTLETDIWIRNISEQFKTVFDMIENCVYTLSLHTRTPHKYCVRSNRPNDSLNWWARLVGIYWLSSASTWFQHQGTKFHHQNQLYFSKRNSFVACLYLLALSFAQPFVSIAISIDPCLSLCWRHIQRQTRVSSENETANRKRQLEYDHYLNTWLECV